MKYIKRINEFNENSKHPIVVNGHTLAIWDGKNDIATVLATTIKKNKVVGIDISCNKYRKATQQDFDRFKINSKGYNLD